MPLYMGDTASDNPEPPSYPLFAFAGYVAGYVTYPTLLERYGHDRHVLSITPNVDNHADCLDVETGDATSSQAGPWVREMIAAGVDRPCVYAQESRMGLVRESLDAEGLKREEYRLWVAAWDDSPTVPAGYDAHQFYGTMTGSWDYSVVSPTFFGPAPKPAPKPSLHIDRYPPKWQKGIRRYDELCELDHQGKLSKKEAVWLRMRRAQCRLDALSVWRKAHRLRDRGKPSWGVEHRGWMFSELRARAQGKRVLPS